MSYPPRSCTLRQQKMSGNGVGDLIDGQMVSNSESGSNSDCATVYVPQNTTRERSGISPVFFRTNMAVLLQISEPNFRLKNRRSRDLVCTNSLDASAPVLDGTI